MDVDSGFERFLYLILASFLLSSSTAAGQQLGRDSAVSCVRRPVDETNADRRPGANGFKLNVRPYPRNASVASTPDGYAPGELYSIVLEGWRTQYTVQTFRGFSLVAVASNSDDFGQPIGAFQIRGDANYRFSPHCWHAVTHTSLHPKTEVEIVWQAPTVNLGCVQFRAMVLEYRDIWYLDDEELTKKLCPVGNRKKAASFESPTADSGSVDECCACDEAKYEMIFDGIWSRQTHPKDFPTMEHLTHFSDLIGGSHSAKYTMWSMGGYATDGLKDLAEWGDTRKYEEEIKEQGKEIRTIIKARGLWYPNVQGTAKAVFRVDKYHHLVSLASMLGPSPDWCVGVSSLDLCLKNCSWIAERTFDLTPWDAGTDGGITYMAPNNPSIPREKIKPITAKDPNDPRSPFFNAHSDSIPPLARLIIRREKVYPTVCKNASEYASASFGENAETSEDMEYKDRRECMVGAWTPWSLCSATCGKGIRMRARTYKNPIKAQMGECRRQTTEKQFCNAAISVCEDSEAFNDICATSEWAAWTDCTVTCGKGVRSRTRNYNNPMGMKKCSVELMQKEMCTGVAGDDCNVRQDPRCQTTFWSEWSPCTHSCSDGIRVRTRLFYYPENQDQCVHTQLMEKETCNLQSCDVFLVRHGDEICAESLEAGQCQGVFPRYYYDGASKTCRRFVYTGCKGNRNNFESEDQCRKTCVKNGNGNDGDQDDGDDDAGKSTNAVAGGTSAPLVRSRMASDERLPWSTVRRLATALNTHSLDGYLNLATGMICIPGSHLATAFGIDAQPINDGGPAVDCMATEWSGWSECSRTCGRGKRQRTRMIKVPARNGGQPCPRHMVEKSKCRLRPCPLDCRMGPWSDWSACSVSCASGHQMRQRQGRSFYRRLTGQSCPPSQTEKRVCNLRPC